MKKKDKTAKHTNQKKINVKTIPAKNKNKKQK